MAKYIIAFVALTFLWLLTFTVVEGQTSTPEPVSTQIVPTEVTDETPSVIFIDQRLSVLESRLANVEAKASYPEAKLLETVLDAILTLISAIVITAVGYFITQKYKESQIQVARVKVVHGLMKELQSEDPNIQEIALRLMATIDCNQARKVAHILGRDNLENEFMEDCKLPSKDKSKSAGNAQTDGTGKSAQ